MLPSYSHLARIEALARHYGVIATDFETAVTSRLSPPAVHDFMKQLVFQQSSSQDSGYTLRIPAAENIPDDTLQCTQQVVSATNAAMANIDFSLICAMPAFLPRWRQLYARESGVPEPAQNLPWLVMISQIMARDDALPGSTSRFYSTYVKARTGLLQPIHSNNVSNEDIEGCASYMLLVPFPDPGYTETPHARVGLNDPDMTSGAPLHDHDHFSDTKASSSEGASNTSQVQTEDHAGDATYESSRPVALPANSLYEDEYTRTADRHIFPSAFYPTPLVPVICVAGEDDIIPLMVSILHQSRVVPHGLPVVGIWYCAINEVCRVFFGWTYTENNSSAQPETRLHIATPRLQDSSTPPGVYDLKSVSDVLALAHLLVQVREHARGIQLGWLSTSVVQEHVSYTHTTTSWRMDMVLHDMQIREGRDPRIASWQLACTVQPDVNTFNTTSGLSGNTAMDLNVIWHPSSISGEHPPAAEQNRLRMRQAHAIRTRRCFEDRLGEDLGMGHPVTAAAWAVDHYVLTLGLISGGRCNEAFPNLVGDFFAALNCDLSMENDESRGAVTAHEANESYSDLCGASPEDNEVRVFALLVSRLFSAETTHVTLDISKETWRGVAEYSLGRLRVDYRRGEPSSDYIDYSCGMTVEYPRCLEYDMVLDAQNGWVTIASDWEHRLPHGRLHRKTFSFWTSFTSGELVAHRRKQRQSTSPESEQDVQVRAELTDAFNHSSAVFKYLNARFMVFYHAPDHVEGNDERTLWTEELKARISQYPVQGSVDAAVSVVINGFYDDLRHAVKDDGIVEYLLDTLSLLRFSRREPAEGLYNSKQALGLVDDLRRALRLPVLLVTYQDIEVTLRDATRNIQRMVCVSAVHFLRTVLKIEDFPVYGLAVCGSFGVPSMTWYSSEYECCFVMDHATAAHGFDLTKESGVLRYVRFLSKMEEHGRKLHKLWEAARPGFLDRIRTAEGRATLKWTASSQLDDYKLWPEQDNMDEPALGT